MTKEQIFEIINAEITCLHTRLGKARRGADAVAAARGERVTGADRIVDWLEHRRDQLIGARDELAKLLGFELSE